MKTTQEDKIPPMKPHRWNSYRPEDIERWGIEAFLDAVAPSQPIAVPDFEFTTEENQRMDELLREEQQETDGI